MKVQVSRIRHPLACFTGEINVEGERTAHAEEIKLAFDYFPIIDAQEDVNEKKSASGKNFRNGGGSMSNGSNGNKSDSESPERFVKFNQNS